MTASVINIHNDPLLSGFYTIRDAARFLRINSTTKLRGWISGHPGSVFAPIIKRTHKQIGNQHEVSFLDLMEMRFIEHYRQKNIPLQTLRVAAQAAREELNTSHPFALVGIRFMNERKKIFMETANTLSADTDFFKRPNLIVAIQKTGLKIIHLPPKWQNARCHLETSHLLLWWERIEKKLQECNARECWQVPWVFGSDGEMTKKTMDLQNAEKKLKKQERRLVTA